MTDIDLPTINQPLFQQVLDQITFEPETHDQGAWEDETICGTTRCVAGWALHFTDPTQNIVKTSRDLCAAKDGKPYGFSLAARLALGLTKEEAIQLFIASDDEEAVALVERYALKGREIV